MSLRTPSPDGLTVSPNAPAAGTNPAASLQEMAVHGFWGRYELLTELPNVGAVDGFAVTGVNPANAPAYDKMRPGDIAYIQETNALYWLVGRGTPAGNDATWSSVISGVPVPPIEETTANRTLSGTDHGRTIVCTNVAGCTIEVPATLQIGFNCIIAQGAAGTVVLDDSGGTTTWLQPVSSASPPETLEEGSTIGLQIVFAATALVYGSLG